MQHNPEASYSIDRDPEGLRLAQAFVNSKSIEEYKKNGQAYAQYAYDKASTYVMLYEVDNIWAADGKVSTNWKVGAGGSRYGEAAAFR